MVTSKPTLICAAGAVLLCAAIHAQTQPGPPADLPGADYYRAGNCTEALARLDQAKGVPRASLMKARCYFDLRDYKQAVAALQQYQAVPTDEEAGILLARAQLGAGDKTGATATLATLLTASQGTSLAVRDAQAEVLFKSGDARQAATRYQEVLKEDPSDIGALTGLADLAAADSKWSEAELQYASVLKLSQDNVAATIGRGMALLHENRPQDAIADLKHAARLRPDDLEISKNLAGCYQKTGKWPDLIQTLEHDARFAADKETTGWMVDAFAKTGDTVAAERYYSDVVKQAPNNITAHLALGKLLDQAKRPEAKEHYRIVLTVQKDNFELSDRMGQILQGENDLKSASEYYAAACKSPQATPEMKLRLIKAYFQLKDADHLREISQANPDNRDVKKMLFDLAAKGSDESTKLAGELLQGEPGNSQYLRALADGAEKSGDLAKTADYLEQAIAVDKDKGLRMRVVGIYTNEPSLNKQPRALELIEELVSQYPDDPLGNLLWGVLLSTKDKERAAQKFKAGFEKVPADVPADLEWAYSSYGQLLYTLTKYEDAKTALLKAMDLNPADDIAVYMLGRVYIKTKQKDELIATREKLAQMNSAQLEGLDKLIASSGINIKK